MSLGAYLYLSSQADTMLGERIARVHLQLMLGQRLLIREQMRERHRGGRELGWKVEDDIAEVPLPFAASAGLRFEAPDGAAVSVAPLQEIDLTPVTVGAELADPSPDLFPRTVGLGDQA